MKTRNPYTPPADRGPVSARETDRNWPPRDAGATDPGAPPFLLERGVTEPEIVGPTGELEGFSERLPPELKVRAESSGSAAARYHARAKPAARAPSVEPEAARIIVNQTEPMGLPERSAAAPPLGTATDGSTDEGPADRTKEGVADGGLAGEGLAGKGPAHEGLADGGLADEAEHRPPDAEERSPPKRSGLAGTTTPGARQIDGDRRRRQIALSAGLVGLALLGLFAVVYALGSPGGPGTEPVASARTKASAAPSDEAARSALHASPPPAAPPTPAGSAEPPAAEPERPAATVATRPVSSRSTPSAGELARPRSRPPAAAPTDAPRPTRSAGAHAAPPNKPEAETPPAAATPPSTAPADADPPKKTDVLRNL